MFLGRGSNLLIRDGGIRAWSSAWPILLFVRIEVTGCDLRCGAGARLKAVAAKARELGLGGLEFLEGIPGSVGGALRMNAGAMGSATFEVVTQVRFMDDAGQVHERNMAQVPVEYRSCPLFKTNIALGATFRGQPGFDGGDQQNGPMNSTKSAGDRSPRNRAPAAFSKTRPRPSPPAN